MSQVPFRVSVSSGTLYHWQLGRIFLLASELEIDGVELVIGPECMLRGAQVVRAMAARHGVRLLSLHPPVLPLPGWTRLAQCAAQLVDWAARLDAPLVTLHTPRLTSLDNEAGQRYLSLAHGLARRLQAGGSQLALENRARYSRSTGAECLDRPADLLSLARAWQAGITFDTAHAGTTSTDILADYAIMSTAIVNVHFSDLALPWRCPTMGWMETVLQHHQIPGTGTLPLRQLAAALRTEDYTGLVTLELSPLSPGILRPHRVRRTLSDCVAFVRGDSAHTLGATSDLTR